jgi:hypothetical protein
MTHTKEVTGKRNLNFSKWVRESNPGVYGFTANDVDFLLRNYRTKEIMVIEVKCYNGRMLDKQRLFYCDLHKILKSGCEAAGWKYKGVHLLQFENTCPADGKIYLDNKEITEDQLKDIIYKFTV